MTDRTMLFYLALLFPVAMMLALLALEELERPVSSDLLSSELENFLDSARPDEVETFVSEGFAPALDRYWRRHRAAT